MNEIVAFTGHRPQHLGGEPLETEAWVKARLREKLMALQPRGAISGMALGVDTWAAQVCSELKIPWIAAIPFVGQEGVWSFFQRMTYKSLLKAALRVVVVSPGGYSPEKMQIRNQWMVDHSDLLLAVYDGTPGGTRNCVNYGIGVGRRIEIINPLDRTILPVSA